jgi:hypothetical protein
VPDRRPRSNEGGGVSAWASSTHHSVLVADFLAGSGDRQVTSRLGEVVRVLDGRPGLYFQSEGRRRTRGGGYVLFSRSWPFFYRDRLADG